jgi:hypothetical protein
MTILDHDFNTGRSHANPVFSNLDFFKYADNHIKSPLTAVDCTCLNRSNTQRCQYQEEKAYPP